MPFKPVRSNLLISPLMRNATFICLPLDALSFFLHWSTIPATPRWQLFFSSFYKLNHTRHNFCQGGRENRVQEMVHIWEMQALLQENSEPFCCDKYPDVKAALWGPPKLYWLLSSWHNKFRQTIRPPACCMTGLYHLGCKWALTESHLRSHILTIPTSFKQLSLCLVGRIGQITFMEPKTSLTEAGADSMLWS